MSKKVKIPSAAIQAVMFVSKDENRENLNCLLVEPDTEPGKFVAVATDGHRLTAVRFSDADANLSEPVLLKRASVAPLAKASKQEGVLLEVADSKSAVARFAHSSMLVELDDSVQYPDWRQVTADGEGANEDVGINPKYVIDLCNHARKYVLGADVAIVARVGAWCAPLGPTHWRAYDVENNITADYVVMPMRM